MHGVFNYQRLNRGHKARAQGQGHKKIRGQGQGQLFRGQTLLRPRTGMLKAKDQGHKRKCSPKKKRSSQKFFRRSPEKNAFQKIFQALYKISTIQKKVLSSSRGQANSKAKDLTNEAKAKDFKMCPLGQKRPRGLHLCQLYHRISFTTLTTR